MADSTITFLLTRLTDMVRIWTYTATEIEAALELHDAGLQLAIKNHGGTVFKSVPGAFSVSFAEPREALAAAVAAQQHIQNTSALGIGQLQVAISLHSGAGRAIQGAYVGPVIKHGMRLLAAAQGGQILVSHTAHAALGADQPVPGVQLLPAGAADFKAGYGEQVVFQVVGPELPDPLPPLTAPRYPASNLPAARSTLIGRSDEVAALITLLRRPYVRLLTLTGTGGAGKTSLALKVAALMQDEFLDDVFWISLAEIRDHQLVGSVIAQTLGISESADQPISQTLQERLRDKHLLLVLNNVEHLLSAGSMLTALLQAAPGLKMMVTSRALLHVSQEHEFVVNPLAVPDLTQLSDPNQLEQTPASALLLSYLRPFRAAGPPEAAEVPVIAAICRLLDGLPLALELAAARARHMPLDELLKKLDHRLAILTNGAHDMPQRHQTLRSTLRWSYDLLTVAEQSLFNNLAVFVGGATLEAIDQVCAATITLGSDVLDGLESLVDKNLLHHEADRQGEPRFSMLETIREYAVEQLLAQGAEGQLRAAHATYYCSAVETIEPHLAQADHATWTSLLDDEYANIRAALQWAAENAHSEILGCISGNLWRFWYVSGFIGEGRRWLNLATARLNECSSVTQARVLLGAGTLAWRQGDYQTASGHLEASLAVWRTLDDQLALAANLNSLGLLKREQGRYAQARACFEESLALRRAVNDQRGVALVLGNLGTILAYEGEQAQAVGLIEEALALFQTLEDRWGIAVSSLDLGKIILAQRDFKRAAELFSTIVHPQPGTLLADHALVANALCRLGDVACHQADYAQARPLLIRSLRLRWEIGDQEGVAASLEGLARWSLGQGDPLRATTLCGQVARIRAAIGAPHTPIDQWFYAELLQALGTLIDQQRWDSAWKLGSTMTLAQAVGYALHTDPPPVAQPG